MNRTIKLWGILCLIAIAAHAQDEDLLEQQLEFLDNIRGSYEGYQTSDCRSTISYHSLRNDVTDGLLTRATNGSMGIEWKTQPIPEDFRSDHARFVWLAAMDMTDKRANFDVYIDGVKRFNFYSGTKEFFTLTNPEGGVLTYRSFETDQNGDSHGYMTLDAPSAWLVAGKPLSVKILGEAAGDNTWVIVFKTGDIMDYLEKSAQLEGWLNISVKQSHGENMVDVTAPARLAGRELSFRSGNREGSFRLQEKDGQSFAQFSLEGDVHDLLLTLGDAYGEWLSLDHLQIDTVIRKWLPQGVLINELSVNEGDVRVKSQRLYRPKTVKSILALNRSNLSGGMIFLMNSSHQDIAWMDSPEKCILERDTMLITPLIDQARIHPDYRFDIEDALMIREYIERHPDRKETIRQLFEEGKISCGSGYSQPYEEMYSGEALVRQFYFGRKWLRDEFGYDANTYWNVDVPGRTLQMPQILKKSGTPYMMISRQQKGIFNWYSPDSSFVTAYSSGHYAEAYPYLHKPFYEAAEYLATSSLMWGKYYQEPSRDNIIPLLSDWDMSPANDYSPIIRQWEGMNELTDEHGEKISLNLPHFKIVTTPELFGSFTGVAGPLPSIRGERPELWLYIHGPGHQKAVKASREGDILLTMAEKFATIDALTGGSFSKYPATRLQNAWEAKIYPDHGWGGKNGQITDDLFRRKFEWARAEAGQILENASRSIASRIKTDRKKGIPVVVFNSLSWDRTDIAEFQAVFDEGETRSVAVHDADGHPVPFQYRMLSKYADGSIQSTKICLNAEQVPSIGYTTYYLKVTGKEKEPVMAEKFEKGPAIENEYYKIAFNDGGLSSIYDKELQRELVDDTKFAAGEVFTMQSVGNGAGEFAEIQQPSMVGFDQTGNHPGEWKCTASGDIFSAWKKRSKLPYATVEQEIVLYHKVKRIDFRIALLNWEGELFREFRMAMPLRMEDGHVAYEVPFGVVEVGRDEMEGAAGERYQVPARELHPRGIENWIGAWDDGAGVTLSSSVAVADYIDPTDDPLSSPVLQPLLLASRVSCHSEGNEYLQTGDHHFSFSLSSHPSGWEQGFRTGRQANEKLFTVVGPEPYFSAWLPESKGFFSVGVDNLVISTVKKAEDDNSIIVRIYEVEGRSVEARLKTFGDFGTTVRANLIEDPINPVKINRSDVNFSIGKYAVETIRLR